MTTPAVVVRGLRVVRGRTTALDGVDLDVGRGTVTGLLGPSGSGKTTLMRAVLGVQRVAAGTVQVLGRAAGSADLRRRIGYVSQAPSVYLDLTVEENLRYFARVLGAPRGQAPGPFTTAEDAIAVVGLGGQRRQLVGTLSGGQLSRVSLAVALLGTPELLVLDEPTVGLDPVLRESLWGAFRDIAAAGTTLLVSSHVMDEAARCDELLLLREGRLLARTTLPELLAGTGEADAERAFLRLIERGRLRPGGPGGAPSTARPAIPGGRPPRHLGGGEAP
ncbi:ABC transporter ATP-binding protein [Georgenia sp. AZ-5]|uniref:ABC transporter ATP-binding protein n=1 Tax=Georgenia sp. AZ-5 TaxID=3367526 RepID=UPI003753F313